MVVYLHDSYYPNNRIILLHNNTFISYYDKQFFTRYTLRLLDFHGNFEKAKSIKQ